MKLISAVAVGVCLGGCNLHGPDVLFGPDVGTDGGAGGSSSSGRTSATSEASSSSGVSSSSGFGGSSSSASSTTGASASSGGDAGQNLYWKSGVLKNVAISDLAGWQQCFVDLYGDDVTQVSTTLAVCAGGKMLLGCRLAGSNVLAVAAMGEAVDVLHDTLPNSGMTHASNGVEWYFDTSGGWGFLPGGEKWIGAGCDFGGSYLDPTQPPVVDGTVRMCWNMHPIHFQQGFRCGTADMSTPGLLTSYERVIFRAP